MVFEQRDWRALGNTGIRVSPVGLGTVKLGRNEDVKYPEPFTIPDDTAVSQLLDTAQQLGINLIDTAPAYGNSETRLGQLLSTRDEWIVCTKVGEYYPDGYDFSAERTRLSIETSLRRLQRDYLDIVLVHSDGNDETALAAGTLEALVAARQAGKVRAIGASTKTVTGGLAALAEMDLVMVELNSTERSQLPVIAAAADAGRGVLIKKALASGHSAAPQQSLIAAVNQAGVSSAIVGTINPRHLADNVAAVVAAGA